jgi:Bacteriophage protein gp37
MNKTKIEWCDVTINPVVGCTFGCGYCYARKMNDRFKWIPDFSKPIFFPQRLKQLESKESKVIFMNSMSDVADWDKATTGVVKLAMAMNPHHNYLFLTKRPLLTPAFYEVPRAMQIWRGVTVTDIDSIGRAYDLVYVTNGGRNLFLSIEPLHEWLDLYDLLDYTGCIDWVIVGAETGNRKGKIIPKKEWITQIVADCKKFEIPIFMKDSLIPIIGEENMLREFPKELKKERKL